MSADILKKVQKEIAAARNALGVDAGKLKLVVGVSGGADSVMLLDVLVRMREVS